MSKDISWQLSIEPGQYETTKFCPDCGKERGISMFRVKPGTNIVTSKYCRVHTNRRYNTGTSNSYEEQYQRAKAALTSKK